MCRCMCKREKEAFEYVYVCKREKSDSLRKEKSDSFLKEQIERQSVYLKQSLP